MVFITLRGFSVLPPLHHPRPSTPPAFPYTLTHYQPPLSKTHNSFSFLPPSLPSTRPLHSLFLRFSQKANFAEAGKPKQDPILESLSVSLWTLFNSSGCTWRVHCSIKQSGILDSTSYFTGLYLGLHIGSSGLSSTGSVHLIHLW